MLGVLLNLLISNAFAKFSNSVSLHTLFKMFSSHPRRLSESLSALNFCFTLYISIVSKQVLYISSLLEIGIKRFLPGSSTL